MKLTFGICTSLEDPSRVDRVISSIQDLHLEDGSEIIIAGPNSGKWITHKKNLLARVAKNDVIVILHDYYLFDPKWYIAYEKFGYDWDVCSNPQFLLNGNRHFTDWVTWDNKNYPRYTSLDYSIHSETKSQYISGGFFLVKKQFLLNNPFDENIPEGSPEDVEWSFRIRNDSKILCNPFAIVIHNKEHRDCGKVGFPFTQSIHCKLETYKRIIGYHE